MTTFSYGKGRRTIRVFDLEELSKLRFGMSEVPNIGGQPGSYEEQWSQWFLERSFFRDFVYRNPRGEKKGQELADAVVLFDDVILMVQVKAQCGNHEAMAWTTEKLLEAFKQLGRTHEPLVQGKIKTLKNDFYGEMDFDAKSYPNRIGLIILAHDSEPYIAAELAPELLTTGFPVHAFSLKDFAIIASRFDTAADFITFLELRGDIAAKEPFFVQDETGNIARMIRHVEEIYRANLPSTPPEMFQKLAKAFEVIATGKLMESPDWKYGLSIDDMIARAHDVDPGLPWNKSDGRGGLEVAQFLGWLTRDRRMRLGKLLISKCEAAQDGDIHYFPHVQPSRGTACVYLSTSQSRPERVKTLQFLVHYAQMKYAVKQCLGVATEPLGNGRSYDFVISRKPLPPGLVEELKKLADPFSSETLLF
jgi:hypothetical protein